ncbi:hypothetical protein MTR_2g062620 [Medicago truncatula]|uniref:Uncharacterized protein n=1 Tax=Medicago truncatula TaxID=3880 RepID=G7IQR2_MEDTR|nr:hypothetical protein MTR_2g062620 [Medicago truncatula]
MISLLDKVENELENSRSDHVRSPIASKLWIYESVCEKRKEDVEGMEGYKSGGFWGFSLLHDRESF